MEYCSLPRLWPKMPVYLEADAFLDYLYHHDGQPSKDYAKQPPRRLTDERRASEIRRYGRKFQLWVRDHDWNQEWRISTHKQVRRILAPPTILLN